MKQLNKTLKKIETYNRLATLFIVFCVIYVIFITCILSILDISISKSILILLPIATILFIIAGLFSVKRNKEVENLKKQYKTIRVNNYMTKRLINLVAKDTVFLRGPEFGDKNEGILILAILPDKTIKKEWLSKEMYEKTFF